MTMFVNLNIVSATASHHTTTGRPFSPIIPSAIAKMMLKTSAKVMRTGRGMPLLLYATI